MNDQNLSLLESYDLTFAHNMHNINWNRKYCPFLGCYCQKEDSFKEGNFCRLMKD